jgi:hypothetical protein
MPDPSLLDQVRQTYEPLAEASLQGQARLVRWHIRRGQLTQAVTLAREWLVSWVCQRLRPHPPHRLTPNQK